MTLKKWFLKNSIYPSIVILALVVCTQLYFIFGYFKNYDSVQNARLDRLSKTLEIAIAQKDFPLIETLLESALIELQGTVVAICNKNQTEISFPYDSDACNDQLNLRFFTVESMRTILGADGKYLYAKYSLLSAIRGVESIFFVFVIAIMFVIVINLHVIKRFKTEILMPLEDGIYSDSTLQISDLESIRGLVKDAIASAEQKAIVMTLSRISRQVVHDVQSPLGALNTAVRSLREDPERSSLLIEKSSQRIGNIIEDLKLKNIIDQQTPIVLSRISIYAFLDEFIQYKRNEFEGRNVLFKFNGLSGDAELLVDRVKLDRSLSNLVNNAVESSENSSSEVHILLFKNEESICIEVADNGKGIHPEDLEKVTEYGYSKGKFGGTGSGLSYANDFIKSCGGELKISSKLGLGTRISMFFPLK